MQFIKRGVAIILPKKKRLFFPWLRLLGFGKIIIIFIFLGFGKIIIVFILFSIDNGMLSIYNYSIKIKKGEGYEGNRYN